MPARQQSVLCKLNTHMPRRVHHQGALTFQRNNVWEFIPKSYPCSKAFWNRPQAIVLVDKEQSLCSVPTSFFHSFLSLRGLQSLSRLSSPTSQMLSLKTQGLLMKAVQSSALNMGRVWDLSFRLRQERVEGLPRAPQEQAWQKVSLSDSDWSTLACRLLPAGGGVEWPCFPGGAQHPPSTEDPESPGQAQPSASQRLKKRPHTPGSSTVPVSCGLQTKTRPLFPHWWLLPDWGSPTEDLSFAHKFPRQVEQNPYMHHTTQVSHHGLLHLLGERVCGQLFQAWV